MTVQAIYQNALTITGYNFSELTDLRNANALAVSFVNNAYADLYYINNKEGFTPASSVSDEINLPENMLNDCISYYVAALIANLLGCAEDFSLYSEIYLKKKKKFLRHSQKDSVSDCFSKGWDS